MILHVLHGGAYGGVEETFYRLCKLKKISPDSTKILFLNSIPQVFNEVDHLFFISKCQLFKYKFHKVYFHSDFRGVTIAIIFKYLSNSKIVQVAHGRLIYASANIFVYYYLSILKFVINKFLNDESYAVSKISGAEYFMGNYKVIDYSIFNNILIGRDVAKTHHTKLNILHIGRYHQSMFLKSAKNHNFILKVLENLNSKGVDYSITFVGEGFNQYFLNRLENIADGNYIVKNNVNDLTFEFLKADVFVFPSIHESFGKALFFAQLFGLNSICSTAIPNESIISKSTITINTDNSSVESWSDGIINLGVKKTIVDSKNDYNYYSDLFSLNFFNQI